MGDAGDVTTTGDAAVPGLAPGLPRGSARDEEATLRERAAALKAAAGAARARLDDATAARRRATAAMRATLNGHARARGEAEEELAAAGVALGQAALHARPDLPSLKPRYARLDRLRDAADTCTRRIAEIEAAKVSTDPRRLLSGTALWLGVLAAGAVAAWALLRR